MKTIKTFGKRGEVRVVIVQTWNGSTRLCVQVDHTVGPLCDWPIQYADGSIAYDYPERISKTRKTLVARAYRWLIPTTR